MEMCFKNIYCENIYRKNTQMKNESIIIYMSDKMHPMHADIMAYRTPLLDVGEHPGYGLLVFLSLLLGGDHWSGPCGGELRGFFCVTALTPSFVLFFAFLDLRPDLDPQYALHCVERALLCSIWDCPQPAMCLLICSVVATAKADTSRRKICPSNGQL